MGFGPFTIDMYLPAFPAVAKDLHTSDTAIQLTLTATTIGFGVGQLVVGPLSDAFGRRRPLAVATSVHVAASLWIMVAPSVGWVIAGRVVQGFGAAGSGVVTMAIARDLFAGQRLVCTLARMALVTAMAPVFAPAIGAQVLRVVSWRGVFGVLAVFGLAMTIVSLAMLRETLPPERRHGSGLAAMRKRYRAVLADKVYLGLIVLGGMSFSTMFIYLSSSSFLYQRDFGLSPQLYGFLFAANAIGLAGCSQISARWLRRSSPVRVLSTWLSVMLLSAVALLLAHVLDAAASILMIVIFVVIASVGGVSPTVQATSLSRHGSQAGTAGSLLGAFNFGVAGVISPLVGLMGISVASMASVMIAVLLVAHLSLWLVVRRAGIGVIA